MMKKDELFKESFVSSWKKWGKTIVEYALRQCDDEGIDK